MDIEIIYNLFISCITTQVIILAVHNYPLCVDLISGSCMLGMELWD